MRKIVGLHSVNEVFKIRPDKIKSVTLKRDYEYTPELKEFHAIAGGTTPEEFLDPSLLGKGTDWQDELFGSSGNSQQHSLSITGGTDKTKMSLSVTNNKDKGLQPGAGYQRNYNNFKLNHEMFKELKLDFKTL